LSLGLEQAGFDVVASVEYDAVHAATHEFNFPRTATVCRSIANLDPGDLCEAAAEGRRRHGRRGSWDGTVDLVAGGPPCQGFSLIGKRLVDDPRNELVFHFFRIVRELRPRYFLMGNVPGMLIGGHSSILEHLILEFEEIGYAIARPIKILNALDYGVPQDRRRVFVLGAREGETLPSYPAPSAQRATVDDALSDLPDIDDYAGLVGDDEVRLAEEEIRDALSRASEYARRLRGDERDPHDLSRPRVWDTRLLTSSRRTKHTQISIERFSATEPGSVEPISRFLRLDPQGACNTLRAGTGSERGAYTSPRPIHPTYPRVLSVREAARLHSFPDWFRLHRTKWHGFRQIGNAVAPFVGRAVGREFTAVLGVAPPVPVAPVTLGDPALLTLTMSEAAERLGARLDELPAQRTRVGGVRITSKAA
jgi:DNA (cytosine-5)-methyltransferase 1